VTLDEELTTSLKDDLPEVIDLRRLATVFIGKINREWFRGPLDYVEQKKAVHRKVAAFRVSQLLKFRIVPRPPDNAA
jgi:hypothetical protein